VNPELRRNLWLQFSAIRLILAPVAIGAVLMLVWLATHSTAAVQGAASWIYYLVVLLWGTRRAADLVAEEVAGGTWDGQRMSALGAWQMSWGKLLGGTSYVWYSAAFAILAWAVAGPGLEPGRTEPGIALARMVATGLFAQSVAFLMSLALLGRLATRRRLGMGVSQIAGLLAGAAALGHLDVGFMFRREPTVDWFLWHWHGERFALASLLAFLGWSIFGIYRLMRVELQFRGGPWGWLAFSLFLMAYAEGFVYPAIHAAGGGLAAWLAAPFALAVGLVYVAVFLERKDVVRYRWLGAALAAGDLATAQALLPRWLPVYILALAGGIALALSGGWTDVAGLAMLLGPLAGFGWADSAASFSLFPLAMALYLLRDVLVVLHFNFGPRPARGDAAALICLALAYFPIPGILVGLHLQMLLPLAVPYPLANPLASLAVPLAECAGLAVLVRQRLGKTPRFTREVAATPAA